MTFGSLFAGIGGMDLGLERAGMECRWQVEINPFCQKVLMKRWPEVQKYGDITKLNGEQLGVVDCIAGGFPCQDISFAGKGAGLSGSRSGLWTEMRRLVCVLRPRFVIVENVSALLERGLGRVLGDLAESGYDAEWDCLPASPFGAYYERDRLFIVAHDKGINGTAWRVLEACRARRSQLQLGRLYRMAVASAAEQENSRLENEPRVDRMVYGVPCGVDRVKGLGNAVDPRVAEWIGRRIMEVAA
jgi:DNA (cytosine-5)-methyltransferase 1